MRKMFGLIFIGLIVCIILVYGILVIRARPIADHPFFPTDGIMVLAHRGGGGLWPENTLYAFKQAAALGVDALEMDIHSTQDGAIVVIHDSTVDRTTNGTGSVQDFTLSELKALDAGYHWTADQGQTFPFKDKGITIPTLAEVFTALPDTHMNIEIKQTQPSLVQDLCRLIQDYGMEQRVLLASFDTRTMQEIRRTCPHIATSTGEDEVHTFYILSRILLGRTYRPFAEALQVPETWQERQVVTPQFIKTAQGRNMQVHVWIVNDRHDMQRLIQWGVDGIVTDYPDQLLALVTGN